MKCRVCTGQTTEIFSAEILKKNKIKYYHCSQCDFLQTEEPFWLGEAYESAISNSDTGILKRNELFARRSSVLIGKYYNRQKKFLDYAGGYGIFVRMMRDKGFDFYWNDPFAENLFARGFEFNSKDDIELVTAFECFEHFAVPTEELEKMLNISPNIIFSTRLFSGTPPQPQDWWYFSLESGQHISFYSIKTLKFLAEKFRLDLNSDNKAFHMLSQKKISNFQFNVMLKICDAGLYSLFSKRLQSKTDSDHKFVSGKKTDT